ncbi:hypothetical protein [Duganella callida]|uniref:DUF945 family protein n=1 Tax=Duganella callida TaxID=2561932 RepID=A0A4Y9SWP9_9BURK|nr:hypothetical protein [Duganella callida]TFW29073.1 hypothetical protein E4L98_04835 [Duganella callida]
MAQLKTFLAGAGAMAAVLLLTGAREHRHAEFDEITAGRINIVEPDGTKRMVISNRAQFPGGFMEGKESARPDRRTFAGMLFMNEEGTENGGLIQKGSLAADGKIDSGLSLTFDRFRQDQALQLLNTDSAQHQQTGISINDVPYFRRTAMTDYPGFREDATKLAPTERRAYWQKLNEDGRLPNNRIWLGNTRDKGASLQLKDGQGRVRLMLLVGADGKAEIQMLDENGKVTKTIAADATPAQTAASPG